MTTLNDVLPSLLPPSSGHAEFDALLATLEKNAARERCPARQKLRGGDVAGAGAALCARLQEATRGVADLEGLHATDYPLYTAVSAPAEKRAAVLDALCQALAGHLANSGVQAAMLALFLEHPWSQVRLTVGKTLVAGDASRATYEAMATVMDNEARAMVWVRNVAAAAAVRLDPATAFERLAARFEAELGQTYSNFARGLFEALDAPWAQPLDPRWYPLLVRFYDHQESVVLAPIMARHCCPAAVRALCEFLEARHAAGLSWLHDVGDTLSAWKDPGTVPTVARAVAAALQRKLANFELTLPLDLLVELGDPSVLPRLRELAAGARGKAKQALTAAIEALQAPSPEPAPPPPLAPKKAARAKPAATAAKVEAPERAALRERLGSAGLSVVRVERLVALARPRILVHAGRGAPSRPGASRLGGEPDLPAGAAWPMYRASRKTLARYVDDLDGLGFSTEGKDLLVPLAFVGQLSLADLAPFDAEGRLPAQGLLSFFVRQQIVDLQGELGLLASTVLFTEAPGASLEPLPAPALLPARERVAACGLTFHRDLPPPPMAVADGLSLLAGEREAYGAFLAAQPAEQAPASLLGHARAVYYLGLPAKGQTLLLEVSSQAPPGFTWGDCSSIFFVLPDKALAARDFTAVTCLADEG